MTANATFKFINQVIHKLYTRFKYSIHSVSGKSWKICNNTKCKPSFPKTKLFNKSGHCVAISFKGEIYAQKVCGDNQP